MAQAPPDGADALFWPLLPDGVADDAAGMDDLEVCALALASAFFTVLTLLHRTSLLPRVRQGWLSMALGGDTALAGLAPSPLRPARVRAPAGK